VSASASASASCSASYAARGLPANAASAACSRLSGHCLAAFLCCSTESLACCLRRLELDCTKLGDDTLFVSASNCNPDSAGSAVSYSTNHSFAPTYWWGTNNASVN
jgi:hypothetical protein